jgi:hypothetical protein
MQIIFKIDFIDHDFSPSGFLKDHPEDPLLNLELFVMIALNHRIKKKGLRIRLQSGLNDRAAS